jgi:y4mF family transcriptional regulator
VFRQNAGASHTILKEPSSNFPVRESYSALAFFRSNLVLVEADNSHHKIPDREITCTTRALLCKIAGVSRPKIPDRETDSIGTFVRERRRAGRLTQPELAALAGVGLRFIVELERGKRTLRMDTVNAVLRVFGKKLGIVDAPRESKSELEE